jgi:hypothetical protein
VKARQNPETSPRLRQTRLPAGATRRLDCQARPAGAFEAGALKAGALKAGALKAGALKAGARESCKDERSGCVRGTRARAP